MFIHFFCLCPLGLATKLNFNISKEAYSRWGQVQKPNSKLAKLSIVTDNNSNNNNLYVHDYKVLQYCKSIQLNKKKY